MRQTIVRSVNDLPTYGFGSQSGPWWGAMAFIALEGMGFAVAIAAYLYLYAVNPKWPISSAPPDLWPGTLETAIFLLSVIPNELTNRVAHRLDLRGVRIGLIVMSVIGVGLLVVRGFSFAHLNTRWDLDAYGSVVWFVLGLHTTHLATDVVDTIVLTILMFTRHATARRFSDVTDNAFYWNFVVIAWLPLYLLLDWIPRL
ncbi:cytochrome c oxidase subunit 3 [Bradyrhizobium australiense]|uniref:Cytochrome C oxidase subunit III n=1 Tax=Bradyrhizobium australiense TaxID=2721161 RepID=A0A7Y4GMB3_9BRAD|nr:cytochrome C oxidase subunit III [Bradyrhizobium australiense]NOJ38420.1 cytochrome C oxidase subunit III [Bradyrhizobium australiense]